MYDWDCGADTDRYPYILFYSANKHSRANSVFWYNSILKQHPFCSPFKFWLFIMRNMIRRCFYITHSITLFLGVLTNWVKTNTVFRQLLQSSIYNISYIKQIFYIHLAYPLNLLKNFSFEGSRPEKVLKKFFKFQNQDLHIWIFSK